MTETSGHTIATTRLRVVATAVLVSALLLAPVNDPAATARRPVREPGVVAVASGPQSEFESVGPSRLADTRLTPCGCERIDANTIRVSVAGRDGVPPTVSAAAITVTATGAATAGYVTAFPTGQPRPDTSTLNLLAGDDSSNSTIVSLGETGSIDLYASVATDVIVDVTGIFMPAPAATGGRYQPTVPTRLLDTRATTVGGLDPGSSVTLPLPAGVAADARAVAINVTSVEAPRRGFLTGYAAGASAPSTSFLNPDGTGDARAASVILPVSTNGFTIVSSPGGHVVVDLVGWFTGDSAASSSDGLLVPVAPTRLLDTRSDHPRVWPGGTREVASPVGSAAAVVTNVTSVDADGIGFVTAYPAGTALPPTSSLNAARRDATTPNLAITTLSTRGTAYYSSRGTDLIVDITAYFTGVPVPAAGPVPSNVAPVPRVLLVGDSTLGGLVAVKSAQSALRGFIPLLDARGCRLLVHPSCTSPLTPVAPNTALDAINTAPGSFDIVVIKTGYNDAARDFAWSMGIIIDAARAKGAQQIIWLTYSESTTAGSYNARNAYLKGVAGTAEFPDLVVADWRSYAAGSSGWYADDRVHLATLGVWATADYFSRWIAHVSRLPCPVPWTTGAALDDPCPSPDAYSIATSSTPNLRGLYGL